MKKIYSILVCMSLLTYSVAIAQPTTPPDPVSGSSDNCTTTADILTCPQNSTGVQTSFTGGTYNRGNDGSHLGVGAIWRFTNITTSLGIQVNAEVKVDASSNANLTNMDNNSGVTPSFFAPEITPTTTGNNSRAGYVQFTITFFKNSVGDGFDLIDGLQQLENLNFVHLDIDGNGNSSAWFRETGVALISSPSNPQIISNLSTELITYSYTDNTTTPGGNWNGYAGSVYERDGVSTCAEVAVAYRYLGFKTSVTFRMGYDFKGSGDPSTTARQYGATFGCFAFPQEIILPVKLLSFSGVYRGQQSILSWAAENEKNFDRYEIERSISGSDFGYVGTKTANHSVGISNYSYYDDLGFVNGNVFFYRLKMLDIDGKAKYSNAIMIRKDSKAINGISLSPNPVVSGLTNVRLTASASGSVEFKIADISGRILLRQQNALFEGNNSISINNLDRLQSGIYSLQMIDGESIVTTKFSVIK